MKENNNQPFPKSARSMTSREEINDDVVIPLKPLSQADVAKRLGISERTAMQMMIELPHVVISRDLYSSRKRVRITEQTYNDFMRGKVERKISRRRG